METEFYFHDAFTFLSHLPPGGLGAGSPQDSIKIRTFKLVQ